VRCDPNQRPMVWIVDGGGHVCCRDEGVQQEVANYEETRVCCLGHSRTRRNVLMTE
jgi:hypothetical protein